MEYLVKLERVIFILVIIVKRKFWDLFIKISECLDLGLIKEKKKG